MSNHFDYLLKDQAEDFFQKVAEQEVADTIAASFEKRASENFEKIAGGLENTIVTLRRGGFCGQDMGMTKRAYRWLDKVFEQIPLMPDQYCEIFDKVAAAALETDLETSRVEFHKIAGDDRLLREAIDDEIQFVGNLSIKLAAMEKAALGAELKALLRAGKAGARPALAKAWRGAGKGFESVGKGVAAPFRAAGKVPGRLREARLGMSERRLGKLNEGIHGSYAGKGTAGSAAYVKSLKGSQATELQHMNKMLQNPKYQAASVAREQRLAKKMPLSTNAPKAPDVPKTPEAPKVPETKVPTTKAPEPAKGPEQKGGGTDPEAGLSPSGAGAAKTIAGTDKTLSEVYSKYKTEGWAALTPPEKHALIAGGVKVGAGVVGGHRVLTGRDLLTGDKSA